MATMMKCGCASSGNNSSGEPVCIPHWGINPGATVVDDSPPDLTGRVAVCCYCRREKPSDPGLAFFCYLPTREKDDFYCGCRGWD